MNTAALYNALTDLEHEAERDRNVAVRNFLKASGWHLTCEYWGYWLWRKEIKGVVVAVPEDVAITFAAYDLPDDDDDLDAALEGGNHE